MNHAFRHGILTVAVFGALAFTVASCAPGAAVPDPAATVATPAPGTVPADSTDSAASDPVSQSPEACLLGEWIADNEFYLAAMREFGDAITSVTGQVALTFQADGLYTTDYRGWLLSGEAEGVATQIERNGTDSGTYSANDTHLSLQDTHIGSTLTVSVGGMQMPITPAEAAYSEAPYTCDATSATIVTPDGTLILGR